MKAFFAILFSVLLVFEQTAPALGSNTPIPRTGCARCHCNMPNCCAAKSAPATPSAPAAPARATTQVGPGDFLLVSEILVNKQSKLPVSFVRSASVTQIPAVPLFQRNCVLLI